MVGTGDSCFFQQQSPRELLASGACMIAPVEHRQHEFGNQFRASTTNLGFNGFGFSTLSERDHMHKADGSTRKLDFHCSGPFLTPNEYFEEQTSLLPPKLDTRTSTREACSPQQNKFVIFDQCGNDMRLIFSSVCARVRDKQNAPVSSFGAQQFLPQELNNQKQTEVCIKTPIASEDSGENGTIDEGSEMREDTDEINALLYSDDNDYDDDTEDDEASTGHSPFTKWEKLDFDDVANVDISSKRLKVLDGGSTKVPLWCTTTNGNQMDQLCENTIGEDSICSYDDEFSSTIGNKRPRKDKTRDILQALKSIMPDMKSNDPLVILEEAITYLKTLKSHAETMSMSSCYRPSI